MRNKRDLFLLLGLLATLVVFAIIGARNQQDDSLSGIPTTHSSADEGALALLRWAQELGYDAQRLEYRAFGIEPEDDALVILSPSRSFNRTETGLVLDWVEAGGILILADGSGGLFNGASTLLRTLDVQTIPYTGTFALERAAASQPALTQPPVRDALVRAERLLELERNDYAPLLGDAGQPVLAGIAYGEGYIYLSSSVLPFTNDGLRDDQNVALLLNLLRRVPAGGRILFDEYHHGFFTPPSLRSVVLGSAWGWALIYALVAAAAYIALSGRRFGRPVPLREETARRSSTEYVESMADLFQRGGKRAYVLQHYREALKRRLARPYGINPRLDDAAFVQELARYRPLDTHALLTLLARMRRSRVSEAELVQIVAAADQVSSQL